MYNEPYLHYFVRIYWGPTRSIMIDYIVKYRLYQIHRAVNWDFTQYEQV